MVEEKPGIRGFSGLQERFMKCLGFKWQTKCSDKSDSWTFETLLKPLIKIGMLMLTHRETQRNPESISNMDETLAGVFFRG